MKTIRLKTKTDSNDYTKDIINVIEKITVVNDVELLEEYDDEVDNIPF